MKPLIIIRCQQVLNILGHIHDGRMMVLVLVEEEMMVLVIVEEEMMNVDDLIHPKKSNFRLFLFVNKF